jgi:tetratricopeptide (TPR) repeat protein
MARKRVSIWSLLAVTLATGCQKAPPPAARTAKPAAEAPRGAGPLTADESKDLCLADPGGTDPLDRALRSLQKKAHELPMKSDEWVSVGRQWVRRARLASDPGFYVHVDGCAAVALQAEPSFAPALELQSLVMMNDHKFDQARQVAADILRREPEDVIALGTLSDALLELGRYDEAAEAAQRQMSVRPGMAAYSRGSYIRWLKGDDRNAKIFIRDALYGRDAQDPEPAAWTFVEAATIFWHLADYDGADAVYAEALRWVPGYPSALVGRARIAMAKEQPRRAIEYLDKAYRMRPLPETAWLLGDALEMLGDDRGAREAYDRVVQQGRRGDRLTLALFYATKNRDIDEALRLIEEERALRGGIHVDDTYAWTLYRRGRIAEARKASDRAIRLGTKEARLLYHAGAIRMTAGDEAGGGKLVQQALTLNPRFDWTGAAEARKLVDAGPRKMARN